MSISLNNHENRIKALENSGSIGWTTGSSATGRWFKESKTGLIIQCGRWYCDDNSNDTDRVHNLIFPTPFSDINYGFGTFLEISGATITGENKPQYKDKIYIDINGYASSYVKWIAIGILYTYRYIIKSAQKFAPLSYLFNKEV